MKSTTQRTVQAEEQSSKSSELLQLSTVAVQGARVKQAEAGRSTQRVSAEGEQMCAVLTQTLYVVCSLHGVTPGAQWQQHPPYTLPGPVSMLAPGESAKNASHVTACGAQASAAASQDITYAVQPSSHSLRC